MKICESFGKNKCGTFIWYLPAKQSMPCDLAMTATTITTMIIIATMTMAMTGPLPASAKIEKFD